MMINNKNFLISSSSSVPVLNPFFIAGFTDAEGCFHIGISKHNRFKQGYSVEAVFKIHLHQKDLAAGRSGPLRLALLKLSGRFIPSPTATIK
jgi:hypothetical protein